MMMGILDVKTINTAVTPSFTATDTAVDEAVGFGTTATFTNKSIGTPSATRVVVVAANIKDGGLAGNITGISVGGTALTEAVNNGSTTNPAAIWYGVVASGTTATIVVTQASIEKCGIAVAVLDGVTTAPTTTAARFASADQNSPYITTSAITIPASGFGVAFGGVINSGAATSWGNMTEDAETDGATTSVNISHNSTPGSISPSFTAANFVIVSVLAATWGP